MKLDSEREGALYAVLSYIMWGIIPVYWKWLQHVPSGEILAHRVIWSFGFMIVLLWVTKKWQAFTAYIKVISRNIKKTLTLFVASLLVTANWGIFIWAINSNHILETSLGYYINPLISVLLGVMVLKEKLTAAQVIAFIFAGIGVIVLAVQLGTIPWVALTLAITFGLYGLAKKLINADSSIGLTLETMMITPIALGYWLYLLVQSDSAFFIAADTSLLLIGGGVATALPLLYFAKGAQKVPMSLLGILQYISPTMTLLLGVFLYHEPFTKAHLIAFLFIWSGLALYSLSRTKRAIAGVEKFKKKIKYSA